MVLKEETVEMTDQSRSYQDPLEGAFDKALSWSFTFAPDQNVFISADDWSGREIILPAGVILELAELIRNQEPATN